MNILIITTHFPPKKGGVETSNIQYLDFFERKENFKVVVLTYENRHREKFDDYWQRSKIIRIKVPTALLEYMTGLKNVSRLNSFYRKFMYAFLHICWLGIGGLIYLKEVFKADIIIANGALIESVVAYALSTIAKKKYAVRWRAGFSGILADIVTKLILRRTRVVGVNGRDIQLEIMRLTNFNETKVFISKHGVNMNIFYPIPQRKSRTILNLSPTAFIVLFAAPLNRTKFCDILVESIPMLLRQSSDYFFIIIGEGPLDSEVSKLERLYKRNMRFVPHFVPPEKLNLYINAADITAGCVDVCYPARMVLESLACGTPVYLFNVARREEVSKKVTFTLPLRNVFMISPSSSRLCEFLSKNKLKIHQIRNNKKLIEECRQYILQNHELNKIVKNEIMYLFELSPKNRDRVAEKASNTIY